MIAAGILLTICLALLLTSLLRSTVQFARFKQFTDTAERQKHLRVWLFKSFLTYFGLTIFCLAILHRLAALIDLPPEFASLSHALQLSPGETRSDVLGLFAAELGVGMALGFLLRRMLQRRRRGKADAPAKIAPLHPWNAAETVYTILLSLNAGLSEEAFFRLLLPMLLTILTRNALLAFIVSGLMFGLIHLYQGKVGVIFTTVMGFVFTVFYLATGQLWIAAAAHAAVDLLVLALIPSVKRVRAARQTESVPV